MHGFIHARIVVPGKKEELLSYKGREKRKRKDLEIEFVTFRRD
jgi:hypothetical protein